MMRRRGCDCYYDWECCPVCVPSDAERERISREFTEAGQRGDFEVDAAELTDALRYHGLDHA